MPTGPKRVPLRRAGYTAPPKGEHYGAQHQRLRRLVLEERPLCELKLEGCTGWATQAHHLCYPATTTAHYQSLCDHCHRAAHQARK